MSENYDVLGAYNPVWRPLQVAFMETKFPRWISQCESGAESLVGIAVQFRCR